MSTRGHKSRQLRPSFLRRRHNASSRAMRQYGPSLQAVLVQAAKRRFRVMRREAGLPGMTLAMRAMKRSSSRFLPCLSGHTLRASSDARRHYAALLSGLLSQSESGPLLQNARLGTWESGLSLGLRQGVTRPIREFNSGDFTMYLTVMWNWVSLFRRVSDRGHSPVVGVHRRGCKDEMAAGAQFLRFAPSAHLSATEKRMKSSQLVSEIRWDRIPFVAGHRDARAWLSFQACRGLALNTLDAYGRNLERYLRFLSTAGKQPHEIRQETVGAYLRDLVKPSPTQGEPDLRMANATIQQHLAVLRMFYDFLVEEERCTRNPFRRGEGRSARSLVQREHRLPTIPTEEEWCRILSEAAKEPIRNRLMLAMSYDAGLRREELCLLETSDIDPSRRTIRVRAETTKNRRSHVLPYSVTTDELYGQYLEHRRTLSRQRGRLFLSQSPRNRAQPVSMWAWSKVVTAIAKRAVAPAFTPHTLRHLCLTDLARADWDIHEIATFAGHRNIETTMIYVHLSARDLAARFNSTIKQLHQQRLEAMGRLFQ